jgi:hypothetical protein
MCPESSFSCENQSLVADILREVSRRTKRCNRAVLRSAVQNPSESSILAASEGVALTSKGAYSISQYYVVYTRFRSHLLCTLMVPSYSIPTNSCILNLANRLFAIHKPLAVVRRRGPSWSSWSSSWSVRRPSSVGWRARSCFWYLFFPVERVVTIAISLH